MLVNGHLVGSTFAKLGVDSASSSSSKCWYLGRGFQNMITSPHAPSSLISTAAKYPVRVHIARRASMRASYVVLAFLARRSASHPHSTTLEIIDVHDVSKCQCAPSRIPACFDLKQVILPWMYREYIWPVKRVFECMNPSFGGTRLNPHAVAFIRARSR